MISSLDLSNALGGANGSRGPEIDGLVVLISCLVAAGLFVLIAIGVSNWRAAKARKIARQRWASANTGPRLFTESETKPNPLRKVRQ